MANSLKVFIDGNEVPCLTDVKVVITNDHSPIELHTFLNYEGLSHDIVIGDEVQDGSHVLWADLLTGKAADNGRNLTIEVEGGVVQDVRGLPEGWTYEVDDRDGTEENENADIEELVLGLSSNNSGDQDNAGDEDEPLLDIQYFCPSCGHEWEEQWSCACDSECPECGARHIQALRWKGVEEEWEPEGVDADELTDLGIERTVGIRPKVWQTAAGPIERGDLYDIAYRCTTPGPEVEEGSIRGQWTGEIDTVGKLTLIAERLDKSVYLFPSEFVSIEPV